MSNVKDIHCNPRLQDLVLAGWLPCCATSLGPRTREKRVAWVSISIHACDPVPIVMGLRLAALWAARAPLLKARKQQEVGEPQVPLERTQRLQVQVPP